MRRLLLIFFQLIILTTLFFWTISLDQKIDFFWNGIIFSSKVSTILLIIIFFFILILFIYRIYLFFRESPKRIKNSLVINNYNKGIKAIVKAIAAMSNSDDKELIFQSKRIDSFLKDNPISLILKAESARKTKQYDLAEKYYNSMLISSDTKIIGLRGLLEQNLKKQDYHHALIYAEEIFNINYKLEWIFETIIQIIVKTKNWQKLIELNKDAFKKKIINKKTFLDYSAIAKYEIALIKEGFSMYEAIKLLNEANLERPNFPPIVKKLSSLLIENNQLIKAKNLIQKCWKNYPHQMLMDEYMSISKLENINVTKNISKLIKHNPEKYDSIISIVKAHIIDKNWEKAKELIKPLLSSKPNKTICELMYEIDLGLSGNMQKANSWKSRTALGSIEKTWVCKITGISQANWETVSESGFLNSLEWTWPRTDQFSQRENLIPNILG